MNARPSPVVVALAKAGPPCLAMRAERAAAALDIGLTTFLKWVNEGKMPKGIEVGGTVLYDFEAVRNAWQALKDAAGQGDGNPFD